MISTSRDAPPNDAAATAAAHEPVPEDCVGPPPGRAGRCRTLPRGCRPRSATSSPRRSRSVRRGSGRRRPPRCADRTSPARETPVAPEKPRIARRTESRCRRRGLLKIADVRSFSTKRQQVPPEAANQRPGKRVECPDEERVEQRALPAAVQSRFHRKPFRDDTYLPKSRKQP